MRRVLIGLIGLIGCIVGLLTDIPMASATDKEANKANLIFTDEQLKHPDTAYVGMCRWERSKDYATGL